MGLVSAGLDNPVHLWWGQCLQPQTLSSPLLQQQSFLRHPEFKGTPFNQPKLTTHALPASGCTQQLGDNRLKIRCLCQFSCALSSVIKTPVLFSCAHCLGLSALELPAWQRCLGQDPRCAVNSSAIVMTFIDSILGWVPCGKEGTNCEMSQ